MAHRAKKAKPTNLERTIKTTFVHLSQRNELHVSQQEQLSSQAHGSLGQHSVPQGQGFSPSQQHQLQSQPQTKRPLHQSQTHSQRSQQPPTPQPQIQTPNQPLRSRDIQDFLVRLAGSF